MVNKVLQTPRFSFQMIGDGTISATAGQTAAGAIVASSGQELEPGDYNAHLQAIDNNLPKFPNLSATFTAGTGVAITSQVSAALQLMRLTLTNGIVTITNALNYGSLQILLWPNSNIQVVDARYNLSVVKDGTGIITTDTPHVSVGSAAASATTLATTMIDTVEQVTLASGLTVTAQKNGPHTAGIRYIAAGATNKLFLNAAVSANGGGVDGSLTVSGTVDVWFIDTGLFS
jgi:hypothetical protein